ncbi:MAG TPA: type IV pilus assembly protein PilM [Candidatus Saccharimonadales bacterium]|nr:type IV pilus assembly protein PilM [Candidatus Saccharimonadales bacterium]
MRSLSGQSNFFGLDLGVSAVRVVELRGEGPQRELLRYGYAPFEGTIALSEAEADKTKVKAVISQLLKQVGITAKNVAVNLPSSHVFSAVIDMDRMDKEELVKTIRYQADSYIPTPLAESKIDWAMIGDSPRDPKKVEVLLSSVPNKFVEARLALLEAVGLNVIAFEPDTMSLARSLVAGDNNNPHLLLDIGSAATDLVISVGQVPHLARSIPIGQQAIVRAASQHLGIDENQAHQFVFKFGLGKDKLEGQLYHAIVPTIDTLAGEIEKSVKFFQGRYPTLRLDRTIVTGGASTLPEFPLYLANKFGMNVEIGNSWRNVAVPPDKQNEAASASNQFAIAAGLAEREP